MRFLPVTLNSLLVELADLEETLALLASLQRNPLAGVEELVPAARTILVRFRPSATSAAALVQQIAQRDLSQRAERSSTLVEIPVHYNGEDLAEVAKILGITADEVVQRHTGSEYTVAFTGFAPGFAYLTGGDAIFNVPRRATPRTKVPAGAVASKLSTLADEPFSLASSTHEVVLYHHCDRLCERFAAPRPRVREGADGRHCPVPAVDGRQGPFPHRRR